MEPYINQKHTGPERDSGPVRQLQRVEFQFKRARACAPVAEGLSLQWPKACRTISEVINPVEAATHPSKHPGGHEPLASLLRSL